MSYEPFHQCSKLDKYFLTRNTVSVNAAPVKKCDERRVSPLATGHRKPAHFRNNRCGQHLERFQITHIRQREYRVVNPVCCQQRKVLDGSLRRHRLITPIAGEMERRERGFLDLLV